MFQRTLHARKCFCRIKAHFVRRNGAMYSARAIEQIARSKFAGHCGSHAAGVGYRQSAAMRQPLAIVVISGHCVEMPLADRYACASGARARVKKRPEPRLDKYHLRNNRDEILRTRYECFKINAGWRQQCLISSLATTAVQRPIWYYCFCYAGFYIS